jgi:hypothetical protein
MTISGSRNFVLHVVLNDNLQNQEIKLVATNLVSSLGMIMGYGGPSIIKLVPRVQGQAT